MIKHFRLLKNIGIFDYVETGRNIALGKLTLCYADNGRGKTTLARIHRKDVVGLVRRGMKSEG